MSQEFVGQSELQEYAERNGLEYVWEYTRTFAKWQRLLAPEQYKIVELRTSRGLSRAMLFSKTILQAERQEPAPVHEATAALASVPQHPHNEHIEDDASGEHDQDFWRYARVKGQRDASA